MFTRTKPAHLWLDAAKDDAAFDEQQAALDYRNERRELQAIADEFVALADVLLGSALLDPVASRAYARIVAFYQGLLTSDQTTPPADAHDFLCWIASGMVDERELETMVA